MHGREAEIYLLVLSLLVLAVGPLLHQLARPTSSMLAALDGFVFAAMAGLVFLHIAPESYRLAGWPALAAVLFGLVGPGLVEHRLHGLARQAHAIALLLALAGIGLHAFADGLALGQGGGRGGEHALPVAVLVHRLPVGLMVWFLLRPVYGMRLALGTLALIGASTLLGFAFGGMALGDLANEGRGLFQALVAGTLLHVVFHRSYPIQEQAVPPASARRHAGLGAVVGMALIASMSGAHLDAAVAEAGGVFLRLAWESAPALLLAYVAAGLVYGLMPRASVLWMGRGGALSQAARGMGFGLPLPICSCGVVPVYRSLVAQGVPVPAAMGFLIATPELSLDALLISLPLLGAPFTLLRVVCAALVALLVGWGVGSLAPPGRIHQRRGDVRTRPGREGLGARLRRGLATGLGEVVDDTAPWIALGLGIAALVEPLLQAHWLLAIPPALEVALFALLGIPTYVCASGATPLAAVLVYKGVSPGAALAFLLTGPATNLTTFGVLSRLHGRRLALAFAGGIMALAIALGVGVDIALPAVETPPLPLGTALSWWSIEGIALLGLGALFLMSLLRRGPRAFVGEVFAASAEAEECCRADAGAEPVCAGQPHRH